MLDIRHSNSKDEIRGLASRGYEPVECSIDGESIVGGLVMDHHGSRSDLEGVAVRAYRDHFGARAADPRFVVTGRADADAAFAVAALAGRLPDRSSTDLLSLAELVNRVDLAPVGIDLSREAWGPHLLLFNALANEEGSEAFVFAVELWARIVRDPPRALLDGALHAEESRLEEARRARVLADRPGLLVVASKTWGFDVWYGLTGDPARASGWRYPVVLWLDERGAATIGCPNQRVAEELFGPGGLKGTFSRLEPPGWGGRESIGGSPRGRRLTEAEVVAAALEVEKLVTKR